MPTPRTTATKKCRAPMARAREERHEANAQTSYRPLLDVSEPTEATKAE
jgi:hypothetical protein